MHKAISKYGLAAHLALLAAAPLFLFPFCGETWTAWTVLWLAFAAAAWMVLEPSRRVGETLHDARFRVASSIVRDPLFWFSIFLALIAAVRWLNDGIGMTYDAEKSLWSLSESRFPFLPGGVKGSGLLPFASVVAVVVLMQAGRHALGKSARVCFLFIAAVLAGVAAVVAALACIFGNPVALRFASSSTVDATYPGTAFGLCFLGSMVAMAGAFERKWHRAMPLLAIAVGGSALGLYLFSPDIVILAHGACAVLVLVFALAYAQRRIGGLVVPKCLAFLLVWLTPIVELTLTGIVPRRVIMEFNTHIVVAIAISISRNDEVAIIQTEIRVTHVGLHDKVTLAIVTAGSTYYIDKRLVVRVLDSQVLGLGLSPIIFNVDFVGSSKSHTIVVASKLAGNIQPQQS